MAPWGHCVLSALGRGGGVAHGSEAAAVLVTGARAPRPGKPPRPRPACSGFLWGDLMGGVSLNRSMLIGTF